MYMADPLSRNYQPMQPEDEVLLEKMVHTIRIEDLEMAMSTEKLESLKKDTAKDEVLSQVIQYTQTEWPGGGNGL
ncbi:Carbamoyl-phosphate synthase large chain [Frankliniella fusca]|uniref:Carbamoyl-phosphate synthase large chain n=1 Tax=Frankliniella fusca TaxID=407009 RepID=A0AAE1H861_9NEOP|nr:Carbamoyl-phosphate synthase large chain [Frankliniella fusca]